MILKLEERIKKTLNHKNLRNKLSDRVRKSILHEVRKDLILPLLNLTPNTAIKLRWFDNDVILSVGPRDFQFDRKTGECIGAGTCLI